MEIRVISVVWGPLVFSKLHNKNNEFKNIERKNDCDDDA